MMKWLTISSGHLILERGGKRERKKKGGGGGVVKEADLIGRKSINFN